MKLLQIKVPKKNEYTHEQTNIFLSSLLSGGTKKFLGLFGDTKADVSLNILSYKSIITFLIGVDDADEDFVRNQLLAQYPNAQINLYEGDELFPEHFVEIKLAKARDLPIQTMQDYKDVDPMVSVLSPMTRIRDQEAFFWVQMVLEPINQAWQNYALARTEPKEEERMSQTQNFMNQLIKEKVQYPGFNVYIRLISNSEDNLDHLSDAFRVFAKANGNKFESARPNFLNRKRLIRGITTHQPAGTACLLNTLELSTIWHLPTEKVSVPNIMWGKKITLDAPEDLPVSEDWMTPEEKQQITFFADTEFKNHPAVFGIKDSDRNKHMYILGKTGTGKTTLLKNLVIDDIRKGKGVAVLDPHGDAVDELMNYIPKNRINDVVYFNPSDPEYAYPLNILELPNDLQGELLVSGIISIFHKLYGYSWGPRLEYILRNVLFTLIKIPGTTLVDVIKILTDQGYRKNLLRKIDDQTILQFWNNEFEQMQDRQKQEAISPIINKVGQFVTSPLIRRVIGHTKSKIKIAEIMDTRKILLCNLSQGRIGEDNATLLGSMLITLIQISAMNRANLPEEKRVPFYLFVDEFQNFATESFIKILSEARKYKLSLTLANQYIDQVSREIMSAILGNIGTFITFAIGAKDASVVNSEFGIDVEPEDLTDLDRFEVLLRLSIDQKTSNAFHAHSLRPPKNLSGHKEKIIEASRARYGIPSARLVQQPAAQSVQQQTASAVKPEQKVQGPIVPNIPQVQPQPVIAEEKSVEKVQVPMKVAQPTPAKEEKKETASQIAKETSKPAAPVTQEKKPANNDKVQKATPIPGIVTDLNKLRERAKAAKQPVNSSVLKIEDTKDESKKDVATKDVTNKDQKLTEATKETFQISLVDRPRFLKYNADISPEPVKDENFKKTEEATEEQMLPDKILPSNQQLPGIEVEETPDEL